MKARSFHDEDEARRFGAKVDKHGWSPAVALHDGGEDFILRRGASQFDAVKAVLAASVFSDWYVVSAVRAVMRDELALALDWREVHTNEFAAEYTDCYESVQPLRVEAQVLWNGQPVDCLDLILVGEWLVYQPSPYQFANGWAVTPWHLAVARLVDQLSGSEWFNETFKKSGIVSRERLASEVRLSSRIVPVIEPDDFDWSASRT